tara:strand:- start:609 stop:1964 length:1356 start_codon:yes stop_codon:yes gene_type:complete
MNLILPCTTSSDGIGIGCKCGSSNCKASSGYYCYVDSNLHICSDSIIACSPGQFFTSTPTIFNTTNTNSYCNACAGGQYQDEAYQTKCKDDCKAGFYISSSKTACSACPTGFWQDQNQQEQCNTCNFGKFNNEIQQITNCKDCADGEVSLAGSSICESSCPKQSKEIGVAGCIYSCENNKGQSLNQNLLMCLCGNKKNGKKEICTNSSTGINSTNSIEMSIGMYCSTIKEAECSEIEITVPPTDCGGSEEDRIAMPNCRKKNLRCQCVQCMPKWHSEDCNLKCPSFFVSLILDISLVISAVWLFVAYIYYSNHTGAAEQVEAKEAIDDTKGDAEDASAVATEAGSIMANTKIGKQAMIKSKRIMKKVGRKLNSLRRLVITRMQIITAILASIAWSPKMPKFLLNIITSVSSVFTVNIPGLLTSMDCMPSDGDDTGITPVNKWYIQMSLPFW